MHNQHAQAHNKKMLSEVGFDRLDYYCNQHTQAYKKKMLSQIRFLNQVGLLLQHRHTT